MRGRYRIRTWLRGRLPGVLAALFPKGADCGAHEWYRQSVEQDACYHCQVTRSHARMTVTAGELATLERAAQAGSRAALDAIDRMIQEGAVRMVPREPIAS